MGGICTKMRKFILCLLPLFLAAVPVQVYKVEEMVLKQTVTVPATTYPIARCTIISQVGGKVAKIYVDEGQQVKKGDLLLELEEKDFLLEIDRAKAALQTAKANLDNILHIVRPEDKNRLKEAYEVAQKNFWLADRDYKRAQNLIKKGVITQQKFDELKTNYEVSKRNLEIARWEYVKAKKGATKYEINLARKRVAECEVLLRIARKKYNDSKIKAPFDGIIVKKMVEVGSVIGTKTPLFILVNISHLKIKSQVAQKYYPRLNVGNEIEFLSPYDREYKITIISKNPDLDFVSHTFELTCLLKNDDNLPAGLIGKIRFIGKEKKCLTVPMSALFRAIGSNVYRVYVVKNNKAYLHNVELGMRGDKMVEVTKGIKKGDLIVISGTANLKDGIDVEVTEGDFQ